MNITIVGGGTAGWIAAYFIKKSQPIHKITVIESSKLGIIGTGEGSTGLLIDLLSGYWFNHKINIDDFKEKTDSTIKMGIRHENWKEIGDSYFAPLDASPTGFGLNDHFFKYVYHKYGKDKIHLASEIGIRYENKKFEVPYALHFDGHKVGEYFKNVCNRDGVTVIDSVVVDIILEDDGKIESLTLDNGQTINADLFIDCTGFSRILMKKIGVGWNSVKDVLSVNTAMPFHLHYSENEKILPETKATALSSGWMWNIPLITRRGCGYVFDNNYISENQALDEVEKYLKQKIQPIKFINFDSGYSKSFWEKNVICFGLSSSFVEPLEATSIHNTIVQIAIFVLEFLSVSPELTLDANKLREYNHKITRLNQLTVDFISLHYQGGRNDSVFWQDIIRKSKITDNARRIKEIAKSRIPSYVDLEGMYGSFSIPLVNWLFAGMDILDGKLIKDDLQKFDNIEHYRQKYDEFYNNIINQKSYIGYL
jgi:hypothetical protein